MLGEVRTSGESRVKRQCSWRPVKQQEWATLGKGGSGGRAQAPLQPGLRCWVLGQSPSLLMFKGRLEIQIFT